MSDSRGSFDPERAEQTVDETRQRRLTEPAKAERREGDPELRCRDVAVEVRQRLLDRPTLSIALRRHLVDLASARADQRELGGDEEGVSEDEQDDPAQATEDAAERQLVVHFETP
jgi:hypothetical protein